MAHPSLALSFRVCNEDTISHDVILSPAFALLANKYGLARGTEVSNLDLDLGDA
jgi:hypothetical protein